jgi:hypothetical protein
MPNDCNSGEPNSCVFTLTLPNGAAESVQTTGRQAITSAQRQLLDWMREVGVNEVWRYVAGVGLDERVIVHPDARVTVPTPYQARVFAADGVFGPATASMLGHHADAHERADIVAAVAKDAANGRITRPVWEYLLAVSRKAPTGSVVALTGETTLPRYNVAPPYPIPPRSKPGAESLPAPAPGGGGAVTPAPTTGGVPTWVWYAAAGALVAGAGGYALYRMSRGGGAKAKARPSGKAAKKRR